MGVPGFFSWLLKYYKKTNIITFHIDKPVDILYLDANCLFHPQCFKILDYYEDWDDIKELENKMIKRIICYIEYLYCVTMPKKKMFISVDGVAPMSKMNQQRKRRFRSFDDKNIKDEIKRKYGKKISKFWSNTAITPGTKFMEKLHKKILIYINKKESHIIYSSYHTAGEGEHKILQDIKKRGLENNNTYVVYGLDADLIFLMMASKKNNIYLLREAYEFDNNEGKECEFEGYNPVTDVITNLNFVSIDEMKLKLNEKLNDMYLKFDEMRIPQDFIDDFIFICYFLGNDFLPHIPSIDIKIGGLDHLLNNYLEVFLTTQKKLLIIEDDIHINIIFLELLLSKLSKTEDYYFKQILPKHRERLKNKIVKFDNDYSKEMWELENMHKEYDTLDTIKLGEGYFSDYKFRYYETYTGVSNNQKNIIDNMCFEYVKGIFWTCQYYFKECCCWEWQYPYSHGPFITDLSLYISKMNFDLNTIKFKNSKPLNPCLQLLSVLPPICSFLLPESYKKLVIDETSDIIDYYPTKIKLDTLNKDMFWKCIPFIPIVDSQRIIKATEDIELTEEENKRDIIIKALYNY